SLIADRQEQRAAAARHRRKRVPIVIAPVQREAEHTRVVVDACRDVGDAQDRRDGPDLDLRAHPIAQAFGVGITHTNCTSVSATKQCGSPPGMNTVSPAWNGRSPCSLFTCPHPRTMKTSCSQAW